ncbi:MAG TPA: hypothetical protein VNA22_04705 [Pyrinomonadaceae bacterium]|nr:hypothetical protein [Pyrinomonadaceae bacterium]
MKGNPGRGLCLLVVLFVAVVATFAQTAPAAWNTIVSSGEELSMTVPAQINGAVADAEETVEYRFEIY